VRVLALSLFVLLSACAGANLTPMVQVPLLRRAGQIEGGVSVRPSSPRAEVAGVIRAAATSHLRLGASVGGATRRQQSSSFVGADREPHRALQAEGFVGTEWGGLLFRFGALLGSGYASSERVSDVCIAGPGMPGCVRRQRRVLTTRYVRSYGQLHVALAPPGPLATALALRIPFVADLSESGSAREADVSPEVALTQSLILRHLRLDLQPVWSRAQGFTFHLALLFRADVGERD
jgi:hypothetical protein